MLDRLRLLDPRRKIADEAEATEAARLGGVAAFLYAATLVFSTAMMILDPETTREAMSAGRMFMPPQDPEVAAMTEAMMPAMMISTSVFTALFAVGAVVCGVVQLKKPTRLIPLFLLLFAAYGVLSLLMTQVTGLYGSLGIEMPAWRIAVGAVSCVVVLALSIVGFRGGSYLYRLQNPAGG